MEMMTERQIEVRWNTRNNVIALVLVEAGTTSTPIQSNPGSPRPGDALVPPDSA